MLLSFCTQGDLAETSRFDGLSPGFVLDKLDNLNISTTAAAA
jgi:hypothetical protein